MWWSGNKAVFSVPVGPRMKYYYGQNCMKPGNFDIRKYYYIGSQISDHISDS